LFKLIKALCFLTEGKQRTEFVNNFTDFIGASALRHDS